MIETSSGLTRKSSAIFGYLRKSSENVRQRSCDLWASFRESSEIFGKWSEICGNSSKTPSSGCLHSKKNITRQLEDMNFIFSWKKQDLILFLPLEHKIHIFSPPCNILYIYAQLKGYTNSFITWRQQHWVLKHVLFAIE